MSCSTVSISRMRVARAHRSCCAGAPQLASNALNEFASVARRKLGLSWERIEAARDEILSLCRPVLPTTLETHRLGFALVREYHLSFYDGMIVAAALLADCDLLYSEDMHHGLVIDGRLRIENPFLA